MCARTRCEPEIGIRTYYITDGVVSASQLRVQARVIIGNQDCEELKKRDIATGRRIESQVRGRSCLDDDVPNIFRVSESRLRRNWTGGSITVACT